MEFQTIGKQSYQSKQDEIHQIGEYLQKQGIEK